MHEARAAGPALVSAASRLGAAGVTATYRRLTGAVRTLPDFLIIGAQRAGTTSLYNYLLHHPQVRPASRKEVHYFDHNHGRGHRWYRSHFPMIAERWLRRAAGRECLTGEGSPYYLFHAEVPSRVAALLPSAKLIVLLRNPIDRAYSHYQHEVRNRREHLQFEEAIDREADRLSAEAALPSAEERYAGQAHRRFSYLARGRYAEQLERWSAHFPAWQLLIIRSEDFYQDPENVFGDVLDYLQLPRTALPDKRRYQAGEYRGMPPGIRARLRKYYQPFNKRLSAMLGYDLGWDDV